MTARTYSPTTALRDVSLSDAARDLLKRWCPRAVTIADFDSKPVRISFATMVRCKERTLAAKLYKQLGLAPLQIAYADEEAIAGCLYVKAPLEDVQRALREIHRAHGLDEVPEVRSVDMGSHRPHGTTRTAWKDDVIVVMPDDDGFIAVGSREWELSVPGGNQLAIELSRAGPVLSLTTGNAFEELSVYHHGKAIHTWVPRGKPSYRSASHSRPITVAQLDEAFGALPRWRELAEQIADMDPEDDDGSVLEQFATSFAQRGFWIEVEGVLDSYAYEPPGPTPELMAFSRGKQPKRDQRDAKGSNSGAAVLAIVSKAIFEKQHPDAKPGDVLPIDRYTSTNSALAKAGEGGSLVLVTVRPGDTLWLVAILDEPAQTDGAWVSAMNRTPVTDITSRMRSIKFASSSVLAPAKGKLGMALQTPRVLAAGMLDVLRSWSESCTP